MIESLLKIAGMEFRFKFGNPFSQTSSFVSEPISVNAALVKKKKT